MMQIREDIAFHTVDSLSAFWPGLQVLAGDVENAIKSHLICKVLPILLVKENAFVSIFLKFMHLLLKIIFVKLTYCIYILIYEP